MPLSIAEFFDRLRESGVLPASDVDALWKRIPPDKRDEAAERLAQKLVESGKLTQYQAAALVEGQGHTLVLGDYVILREIGAGGMGQVFEALHRRMKRSVALKVLPPAVTNNPESIKRFQREVEAAARLTHPNIVAALDAGEQKGIHYLVMEYVAGDDLAHVVRQHGALSIEHAISYTAQAAKGLAHAHKQGVIHRDIKPANWVLEADGTVKILDMGLARFDGQFIDESVEGLTNSGAMLGTIDYMSPEQALDTKSAGPPADVYSLGCTLYFLLTGRRMYEGETVMKRLVGHRELPIPALSDQRTDVPLSLRAIFARMVAKRPEDRYPSMAQVQEELESCRLNLACGTQRPSAPPAEGRKLDLQVHDLGPAIGANRVAARPAPRAESAEPAGVHSVLVPLEPGGDSSHVEPPPLPAPSAIIETAPSLLPPSNPLGQARNARVNGAASGPPLVFWFVCAGLVALFMVVISIALPFRIRRSGSLGKASAGPETDMEREPSRSARPSPELEQIEPRHVDAGTELLFSVNPKNPRTGSAQWVYRLGPGAPKGAKIDANSGVFTWIPSDEAGGKDHDVTVVVTDGASPTLRDQKVVRIHVYPAKTPMTLPGAPKQGKVFENSLKMKLVYIPSSEFDMGSPDSENGHRENELLHRVRLTKGFYMGAHEVTVAQFREFVQQSKYKTDGETDGEGGIWRNAGFIQGEDHPVVNVSWNDARAFCDWLGKQEHRTYRLPTEAEWEYACRAGTQTAYVSGNDPEMLARTGNMDDGSAKAKFPRSPVITARDGYAFTAPVGKFQPNAFGLFDMHGNVWEWCGDWYADYSGGTDNPKGPVRGVNCVVRGGSWSSSASYCRAARRGATRTRPRPVTAAAVFEWCVSVLLWLSLKLHPLNRKPLPLCQNQASQNQNKARYSRTRSR